MIVADLAGVTRAHGDRTIFSGVSWDAAGPDRRIPRLGAWLAAAPLQNRAHQRAGDTSARARSRSYRRVSTPHSIGATIAPGAVHEYQSFCILKSGEGWMEGHYGLLRQDGTPFEATIPRFILSASESTSLPS